MGTLPRMERDPSARLRTMLDRAVHRRCPRCGEAGAFASWSRLHEWCPACGFAFEREHGYWVGAVIVNTTVTFALFLVVFVGGMLIAWPSVPWTPLFVATVLIMLVVPIGFYPWSKAIWMAFELSFHQLEPEERAAAAARVDR